MAKMKRRDFLVRSGGAALSLSAGAALASAREPERDEESGSVKIRTTGDRQPIMLDTQALIWVDQDDDRLGARTRQLADTALSQRELYVSSVTFWEVISLARKQHIEMQLGVSEWRRSLLDAGVRELGVDGIIGVPEDDELHGDFFRGAMLSLKIYPLLSTPRDRLISTAPHLLGSLIVASAIRLGATLISTDKRILEMPSDTHRLNRQDARN